MKRTHLVTVFASVVAGAAVVAGSTVDAARDGKPPMISGYLARPVMTAQQEMNKHNYAGAIAELKKAVQAQNIDKNSFSITGDNGGRESAYDKYVIAQMMAISYYSSNDLADAAPLLRAAALSPYSNSDQTKQFLTEDMAIYYQALKNYPECIVTGQELIQLGMADSGIYTTIALSQMAQGKDIEAARTLQTFINQQPKPEEKLLTFQWNAYTKANDAADASQVVEQLVRYYPKPEYWMIALSPLLHVNIQDPRLQLDMLRLMDAVGALTNPGDYLDTAGLALDQGYPREAVSVLKKGFANHVFTEPRDVNHSQQLLTEAQHRAAADQKTLPQETLTATSGDALVSVGAAYLSYGQPDKAADLINQGIAKGGLRYPEHANLLLGMAQLQANKATEAQRAFNKVETSSNEGYARLGKLWELHAQGRAGAATGQS